MSKELTSHRRLKRIGISPELLVEALLRTGEHPKYRIMGAPVNAAVIRCGYDFETDLLYALLRHDSFEEVPEGQIVPLLPVTITRIHEETL